MKILVVSEGNHELNLNDNEPRNGPLVRLIDRVLKSHGIESPPYFERRAVRQLRPGMMTAGKAANYQHRAVAWIRQAQLDGFDALVLVVDQDNSPDRQEGLDAAHESQLYALPRAIGLAVKTFDAWMLADEQAISKAIQSTVQRQKSPESINDPKQLLHDLIQGASDIRTVVYLAIAEHSSLDTLRERCCTGFEPFHRRLAQLVAPAQ